MNNKRPFQALKDYADEREMRRTGGFPESASFHSKTYHRYFDGYSEYTETDEKGRTHVKRVYTGVYHRRTLTAVQQRWLFLTYILIFIMSILLYLYATTRYVPSNSWIFVTVPQAAVVLCLLWLFWSLFNYLTAKNPLTLGEFRYVSALKKSSAGTAAALAVTGAATLLYTILHYGELEGSRVQEFSCAALFLVCGLLCFGIRFLESRVQYESYLSKQEAPRDSAQVSS